MGSLHKEYKKYSDGIRLEYGFIPDFAYYTGRLKILEKLYNREYIYYTEYFRNLYEVSAKNNLKDEIKWIVEVLK